MVYILLEEKLLDIVKLENNLIGKIMNYVMIQKIQ